MDFLDLSCALGHLQQDLVMYVCFYRLFTFYFMSRPCLMTLRTQGSQNNLKNDF